MKRFINLIMINIIMKKEVVIAVIVLILLAVFVISVETGVITPKTALVVAPGMKCPPGTSVCEGMYLDCSGTTPSSCVTRGYSCYITGCEKCAFAMDVNPTNAGRAIVQVKSGPWKLVVVDPEKCNSYCHLVWDNTHQGVIPYCADHAV
jgi:hypothetical protein